MGTETWKSGAQLSKDVPKPLLAQSWGSVAITNPPVSKLPDNVGIESRNYAHICGRHLGWTVLSGLKLRFFPKQSLRRGFRFKPIATLDGEQMIEPGSDPAPCTGLIYKVPVVAQTSRIFYGAVTRVCLSHPPKGSESCDTNCPCHQQRDTPRLAPLPGTTDLLTAYPQPIRTTGKTPAEIQMGDSCQTESGRTTDGAQV